MIRFSLITLASLLTVSCATTKEPAPLANCQDVVQKWAGQEQVQGMPQPDGGVVFVKPRLDGTLHLFLVVSQMNAGKVMRDVKQNATSEVKVGECAHPANGYPYATLQFSVKPQLQRAGN